MAHDEKNLSAKWLYLAWFGVALCSFIIALIASLFRDNPEKVVERSEVFSDFTIFAILVYVFSNAVAVFILFGLMKNNNIALSQIGFKGTVTGQSLIYIGIFLIVSNLIYIGIDHFLRPYNITMYWGGEKSSHVFLQTPLDVIVVLLFAVLIGPLVEEIIFRGYLLTMLTQRLRSTLVAVLIAALVFTSIHIFYGPGALIFIFFWSFFPAFLYLKYDSLYPGILFHVINNLLAFVVCPLVL